jgi:hypothetical protein
LDAPVSIAVVAVILDLGEDISADQMVRGSFRKDSLRRAKPPHFVKRQ